MFLEWFLIEMYFSEFYFCLFNVISKTLSSSLPPFKSSSLLPLTLLPIPRTLCYMLKRHCKIGFEVQHLRSLLLFAQPSPWRRVWSMSPLPGHATSVLWHNLAPTPKLGAVVSVATLPRGQCRTKSSPPCQLSLFVRPLHHFLL